VKRFIIISISIALLAFLSLIPALAQPPGYGGPPPGYGGPIEPNKQKQRAVKKQERKPIKDANSLTDPNDPNATIPAYKMYEGLEEALEQLNRSGEGKIREWERGEVANKINLAKTAEEQITAELNFIRELAVEEGAAKTTAAIDGLLAHRQKRSEEINQKLEEARKRQRAREERKDKDRSRGREPRRRSSEGRRTRNRPLP